MSSSEFVDLQEALLYVFWPILVVMAGLTFSGGLLAAVISVALQIVNARGRSR